MMIRTILVSISVIFAVLAANAQQPLPRRTPDTDREALRLMRNEKLRLILPGAMHDNNVDMFIYVARDGGPMSRQFGLVNGYLIFTDRGDKIDRAFFGESSGAVENIDVRGSENLQRAFHGYNYNDSDPRQGFTIAEVYDEITQFVAERDPMTIAVNFSDWLTVADGISHAQFLRLEKMVGSKYAGRIVSAENLIGDFLTRRTSREIAAQTEVLALARQANLQSLSTIVPGITTAREIGGARIYYSAVSKRTAPPDHRWWINDPDYVFQRGDFFTGGGGRIGGYMGFGVDTKTHTYILREGETTVPESIQYAWDQGKKAQVILRPHIRVGMTGGESLNAMVKAMEDTGYIYTKLIDNGIEDYKIIQKALAKTDKSGFYLDLHTMGNNGGDIRIEGPSMGVFRANTHQLKIQENHIFAFEYAVYTNLPDRRGYPIAINFSNPQVVTRRGVEWIQPPNDAIILIR